jgi:hypothetical protein
MAECKRFRTEDIPPRLDNKQKLLLVLLIDAASLGEKQQLLIL